MKVHIGQLYALVKADKPIEPGDTLSHSLMDELKAAGLAERNKDGHWVITDFGKLLWQQLLCKSMDIDYKFVMNFR